MADTDWIELSLNIPEADDEKRDIAVAILADIGFESFSNTESGITAYISSPEFTDNYIKSSGLLDLPMFKGTEAFYKIIERVNWNSEWEKNFQPVIIAGRCSVRASFHPKPEKIDFDIIIDPKMSFGTGHNQTTALMTELLLNTDVNGLKVLDMGCGTGILAILASMKGSREVSAVDIDEWACSNTSENCINNKCIVSVRKGDIATVTGEKFDLILANITRNILLENMELLCSCLNPGGLLFLSGFYKNDLSDINIATGKNGLLPDSILYKDEWCAAAFRKN
jgi:ribosomal protein L11 methyltransferase